MLNNGFIVAMSVAAFATAGQSAFAKDPDPIVIVLQNAPNNMEPVSQPASIRVDNRATVRINLFNISPLDSCSLTRSPTPTTETNPFQALLGTISGFGAIGVGPSLPRFDPGMIARFDVIRNDLASIMKNDVNTADKRRAATPPSAAQPTIPPIEKEAVYTRFVEMANAFPQVVKDTQSAVSKEQQTFDDAGRGLVAYVADDYRGSRWSRFDPRCAVSGNDGHVECSPQIKAVTDLVGDTIKSVTEVAKTQATLDILTAWNQYLHKKYETIPSGAATDLLPDALADLQGIDKALDHAKALVSLLNDGITALKASQVSLRTAYLAALKIEDDFYRRTGKTFQADGYSIDKTVRPIVHTSPDSVGQVFVLGTDRKDTVNGTLVCVSWIDGKTPTTDTINYSILYQDIPTVSLSVGVLTTFLHKTVIGTTDTSMDGGLTSEQIFAVTDRARAQVFPMAFFNYRLGGYDAYKAIRWGRGKEDRILISTALSAGIGVNSNTGTNQPEFFTGISVMLNKLVISPGAHFGRVEELGGGFSLNEPVPSTVQGGAPITWRYRPALSIGFSFRTAPW